MGSFLLESGGFYAVGSALRGLAFSADFDSWRFGSPECVLVINAFGRPGPTSPVFSDYDVLMLWFRLLPPGC